MLKLERKTSEKILISMMTWLWLEFKNVKAKMDGLKARLLILRLNEKMNSPCASRELLEWAKKKIAANNGGRITIKAKVSSASQAKYKLYTRWRREDLLTQVAYNDIIKEIENVLIWTK